MAALKAWNSHLNPLSASFRHRIVLSPIFLEHVTWTAIALSSFLPMMSWVFCNVRNFLVSLFVKIDSGIGGGGFNNNFININGENISSPEKKRGRHILKTGQYCPGIRSAFKKKSLLREHDTGHVLDIHNCLFRKTVYQLQALCSTFDQPISVVWRQIW